ncbi:ATP-binding cassette domain-containing protein [candidate division KSB1 bacterium]|nr:ATP-binding cassette domain-containing protein [candidate division KSB1 bacterium]
MDIKISNLEKIYPNGNRALKDINLTIESGMFGLLGPNGAGKTTLMRILVTLLKASKGEILVDGQNLQTHRKEIRALLGYLPQDFSLFSKLTTFEFLEYCASLAGMHHSRERKKAVADMLERVGLYEVRTRQANKLSGGMKRRLGIAQALIGTPKIVIVDEPTTGLDPEERIRFRNLLAELGQKEMIIILSTHIVGDISSTCTNMALLLDGSVAFQGPPQQLLEQARGHVWKINALDQDLENLKNRYPVISTIPGQGGYDVEIVADQISDYKAKAIEPNLEHAYVYFVEQAAKTQAHHAFNINRANS